MNPRYNMFQNSTLGKRLIATIDAPDRMVELIAFSREGFPAVTALVSELRPILLPLKMTDRNAFNFAKQFVGDRIGDMMRSEGYRKIRDRKAVPGDLFSYGAVWGK